MVSVSTARQRPHPLPAALAAAVAGVTLALTGAAPAGAEPPGAPGAVPSRAPDWHRYHLGADPSVPGLPPWLDPALEPMVGVSRAAARPGAPAATDPPAPATPAPSTPPPATPPPATTAPATPAPGSPAPATGRPAAPAVPDRTEGRDHPAPQAALAPPDGDEIEPMDDLSGQGADWAAQPVEGAADTRGLDQRVPATVPSPTPDAAAQPAARLASAAGHERPDWFARSLVYSGLLGLTIALYGLSMVLRRRRTW
jgi:hypothetical protein